jgi:ferredoxin--NADP+ reductase
VQAAFTNPELRELGEMTGVDVEVSADDLELDEASARFLEEEADGTTKRNIEVLRSYAEREPTHAGRVIELKFLRSPVEILGEGENGKVTGVRLAYNRIEVSADGRMQAVPTGEEEVLACGAVFRSIGYRGRPCDDVPFDERRGLIRNEGGRVCAEDGAPCTGEYAVGWIKRGPSGVIGTNKKDAADTTSKMIEDRDAGRLNEPAEDDPAAIADWLAERVPDLVTWEGWQAIDEAETAAGEPSGRPRVKLVRHHELRDTARTPSAAS